MKKKVFYSSSLTQQKNSNVNIKDKKKKTQKGTYFVIEPLLLHNILLPQNLK